MKHESFGICLKIRSTLWRSLAILSKARDIQLANLIPRLFAGLGRFSNKSSGTWYFHTVSTPVWSPVHRRSWRNEWERAKFSINYTTSKQAARCTRLDELLVTKSGAKFCGSQGMSQSWNYFIIGILTVMTRDLFPRLIFYSTRNLFYCRTWCQRLKIRGINMMPSARPISWRNITRRQICWIIWIRTKIDISTDQNP
jgi:hypothetical protein